MSKRTIALILFLLIITGVLLGKALTPPKPPVTPPIVAQPTPVIGHTVLSFNPNPLAISSASGSIDVNVDSGGDNLTGVQLEMAYDPSALTITKAGITPGTFFDNPMVLRNSIDEKNGKISYAIVIPLSGTAKKGIGTVAKINFTANRSVVKQTILTLTPKSLATADGVAPSVLKSTNNAIIVFTEQTSATTP